MRLTPDLIEEACQFVNPLKERELDLRAKKIQVIENLACTSDQVFKLCTKFKCCSFIHCSRKCTLGTVASRKSSCNIGIC